jgi:hypothetical protein
MLLACRRIAKIVGATYQATHVSAPCVGRTRIYLQLLLSKNKLNRPSLFTALPQWRHLSVYASISMRSR